MAKHILQTQAEKYKRPFPELRTGHTVRVHQKVQEEEKEGDEKKERIQMFEGLIIAVHRGRVNTDGTITVRRIVEGVGVERVFPICSTNIAKIDVVKVARVRRAKLSFLRGRHGKSARLSERFTTADEFQVAVERKETKETKESKGSEEIKK